MLGAVIGLLAGELNAKLLDFKYQTLSGRNMEGGRG